MKQQFMKWFDGLNFQTQCELIVVPSCIVAAVVGVIAACMGN
jgi:hypothetical protein